MLPQGAGEEWHWERQPDLLEIREDSPCGELTVGRRDSKGLQELAWSITVYNEMSDPDFDLRQWEAAAKSRRLSAIAKEGLDETLRKGLCLVDAKSLFDHLVKTTVGATEDRRTAIEMQLVRQSMLETGTTVKWVNHERMLADCLTKRLGNRIPLYEFLRTGILNFSKPVNKN